jgi:hypothetical protein
MLIRGVFGNFLPLGGEFLRVKQALIHDTDVTWLTVALLWIGHCSQALHGAERRSSTPAPR